MPSLTVYSINHFFPKKSLRLCSQHFTQPAPVLAITGLHVELGRKNICQLGTVAVAAANYLKSVFKHKSLTCLQKSSLVSGTVLIKSDVIYYILHFFLAKY